MVNYFEKALAKIIHALNTERINYMIVGGFAVSFHNRARTTNDIDFILQIYPHHVSKILKHFPEWKTFEDGFAENVEKGLMFNITDFETGVRFDFMTYKDSDYNWAAFERRKKINFLNQECFIASKEDLFISKLIWYNISKSDKQLEDLQFLALDQSLNRQYITFWTTKLFIDTHGILES